jgi:predicted nucleic-acid-binding protein
MIALDTNVLLRYLVQDGDTQALIATRLIENDLSVENRGFVSLAVVCELVWALGHTYKQSRAVIADTLFQILDAPQIEMDDDHLVRAALEQSSGDIADTLIHLVGQACGCTHTVTFDRKFARLPGVELLSI